MLFAAGMDIGLMFFGVLEPVYHTLNPPLGVAAPQFAEDGTLVAGTVEAAREVGMAGTIFHAEALPLASFTSLIGIVLVIVFFVTSSDSGSLVIDTITAGGKVDAPVAQRIFWCIFEGLVAAVLLLGGGLGSLQAAAIATGLPFAIVLIVMCWSLVKGLRQERRSPHLPQLSAAVE